MCIQIEEIPFSVLLKTGQVITVNAHRVRSTSVGLAFETMDTAGTFNISQIIHRDVILAVGENSEIVKHGPHLTGAWQQHLINQSNPFLSMPMMARHVSPEPQTSTG